MKIWNEEIWVYRVTINESDQLSDYLVGVEPNGLDDGSLEAIETVIAYITDEDYLLGFVEKVECIGLLIMKDIKEVVENG